MLSGYPNTEKRLENTTRCISKEIFGVWIADETLCGVSYISSQSKLLSKWRNKKDIRRGTSEHYQPIVSIIIIITKIIKTLMMMMMMMMITIILT